MAEYGKLASQTMGSAKVLSFGPAAETIEGEWHGTQTVLLEFESVEAAKEWYYSDAYQEAAKIRQAPRSATASSSPASDVPPVAPLRRNRRPGR